MDIKTAKLKVKGIKAGSYLRLVCRAPYDLYNGDRDLEAASGEAFTVELQYPTIHQTQQYVAWAIHQGWAPEGIVSKTDVKVGRFLPPYIMTGVSPSSYLRVCDYKRYRKVLSLTNAV